MSLIVKSSRNLREPSFEALVPTDLTMWTPIIEAAATCSPLRCTSARITLCGSRFLPSNSRLDNFVSALSVNVGENFASQVNKNFTTAQLKDMTSELWDVVLEWYLNSSPLRQHLAEGDGGVSCWGEWVAWAAQRPLAVTWWRPAATTPLHSHKHASGYTSVIYINNIS